VKTKTFPSIVKGLGKKIGTTVIHHMPIATNKLGQSGLHTLCDDVIDIVLNSENESMAYKKLWKYFTEGEVELGAVLDKLGEGVATLLPEDKKEPEPSSNMSESDDRSLEGWSKIILNKSKEKK
jgi:hypothetical protein